MSRRTNLKNTRNSVENVNDERKEIKCFKCKKFGHFARYCKKQSSTQKKNNEESKCAEVAMKACAPTGNVQRPGTVVAKSENSWCLDSGASSHICHNQSVFEKIQDSKLTLNLATTDSTEIHGTGTVKLDVSDKVTAVLRDTLFVPNLRSNLLSVAKITDYGHEVTFRKNSATIVNNDRKNNEKIMETKRVANLYVIDGTSETASVANVKKNSWQTLHENFGHLNMKDLKYLVNRECMFGIKVMTGDEKLPTCEVCVQGKLARIPFDKSSMIA